MAVYNLMPEKPLPDLNLPNVCPSCFKNIKLLLTLFSHHFITSCSLVGNTEEKVGKYAYYEYDYFDVACWNL